MTDRQDSYQDELAEYLQARGLDAHNNNTGGNCMVVEMYGTADVNGPRIVAVDSDLFGYRPDGTLPPADTFYVGAFTDADDVAGTDVAYEATPDEVARLFAEWRFLVECPTPSV